MVTAKQLANLRPAKKGEIRNPKGRPKGTLKDFVRDLLIAMPPKQKRAFLKRVQPETQWKMAEGNPAQETELKVPQTLVELIKDVTRSNPVDAGSDTSISPEGTG